MNLQTQFERYIEATIKHGEATSSSENYRQINKAYSIIQKSFNVLMNNENGKDMLYSLLFHKNKYVSSWTAMLLIHDFPKECEEIICKEIKEKGIWAGTIRTFYEEWKLGNIKR